MKVAELIAILSIADQGKRVVITAHDGGFSDVKWCGEQVMFLDANGSWGSQHDTWTRGGDDGYLQCEDPLGEDYREPDETAVLISRFTR
jgi:hypothetical protein